MKMLLAATALMVAPIAAHAACAATDFAIQDVKVSATGTGIATRLSVKGKLVNNCTSAAAAQVRVDAKDGAGHQGRLARWHHQHQPRPVGRFRPGASAALPVGHAELFRQRGRRSRLVIPLDINVRVNLPTASTCRRPFFGIALHKSLHSLPRTNPAAANAK
jgi:hypothetical protein